MAKEKLIVALDYPSAEEALAVVEELKNHVALFKVGLQLFSNEGPPVVKAILDQGANVFLDLKLHDIPNTAAKAAVAAARMGVSMMNFHCLGGRKMLSQISKEVSAFCSENSLQKPALIGVTILTSLNDEDIQDIGISKKVMEEVEHLSRIAKESGLNGVVASPHEIKTIKNGCGQDFLVVTPGIRPLWSRKNDQERITTPSEAVQRGADYIVVGRPITGSPDRKEAAERIIKEMAEA
jgi:orotidine-5'-phosphate decarboxylase